MAVDDARRRDDLYDVRLRAHDERVDAGGWTYYVRGVAREAELLPRTAWWGDLLVDLPLLASRAVQRLRSRNDPWIVAVVRMGSVRTWRDVRPEVVHREVLALHEDPGPRISQLVDDVTRGRFAPQA